MSDEPLVKKECVLSALRGKRLFEGAYIDISSLAKNKNSDIRRHAPILFHWETGWSDWNRFQSFYPENLQWQFAVDCNDKICAVSSVTEQRLILKGETGYLNAVKSFESIARYMCESDYIYEDSDDGKFSARILTLQDYYHWKDNQTINKHFYYGYWLADTFDNDGCRGAYNVLACKLNQSVLVDSTGREFELYRYIRFVLNLPENVICCYDSEYNGKYPENAIKLCI